MSYNNEDHQSCHQYCCICCKYPGYEKAGLGNWYFPQHNKNFLEEAIFYNKKRKQNHYYSVVNEPLNKDYRHEGISFYIKSP